MEFEKIHQTFLDIEAETDAFDLKINGIPIWERVRFDVHRQVMRKIGEWEEDRPTNVSQARRRAQRLWLLAKNLFRRNPYLATQHDVLYWGHSRRRELDNGYWWEIYTDPIHMQLPEQDYLHVETPYNNRHRTPARTGNLRYLDLIQVTAGLRRQLGMVEVSLPTPEREELRIITEAFQSEFGIEISIEDIVLEKLSERESIRPLYERFLKRVNPRVVVVVVHYGKETFLEVCNALNIPVVELQHGILTEYEYGYSYPGFRTKETFPDYLFTWGEFWNTNVEFPIDDECVIPVGYPYMEMNQGKYADIETKDQVLFLSQPPIGQELSKIAVDVAESSAISSNLVFKLHPYEYEIWKKAYPWLRDTEIEVIDDSNPPLYKLLAASATQVGVFTTALYEGLAFDLNTFLFDLPGVEHLSDLYREGPATLVGTSDELIDRLRANTNTTIDSEPFFASDAVANISRELNQIKRSSYDSS